MSTNSIWSEIIAEHVEEVTDTLTAIFVDAYSTSNANESGVVIAKVLGERVNGDIRIDVDYLDARAKTDGYAQEVITEAIASLREDLKR